MRETTQISPTVRRRRGKTQLEQRPEPGAVRMFMYKHPNVTKALKNVALTTGAGLLLRRRGRTLLTRGKGLKSSHPARAEGLEKWGRRHEDLGAGTIGFGLIAGTGGPAHRSWFDARERRLQLSGDPRFQLSDKNAIIRRSKNL